MGGGPQGWFTPPSRQQRAPAYKQFLITFSAIYPLTIIRPWLLNPFLEKISWLSIVYVRQFVLDAAIVALIVYVIMPRYTRLLAKWLYE